MQTLLTAVLVASFAGSAHCAGMCGPLAALAFRRGDGDPHGRFGGQWGLQFGYQGGRLASYAALGLAAGALGGAVDLGGALVGVQRLAVLASGALLIVFGLQRIAARFGRGRLGRSGPSVSSRLYLAAHRRLGKLSPGQRASALGLLSALLPCGWLYAFAAVAAGTGAALSGAAVMATFWLGGLPVMVALGAGLRKFWSPLERRVPLLGALALIAAGGLVIAQRSRLEPLELHAAAHRADPAAELHTAATETPACCDVAD